MTSRTQAGAGLLPGVDRAAFAAALTGRLRSRGVPVGVGAAGALTEALRVRPPRDRTTLYWTARVVLVHRHAELAAFDAVFDVVFGDAVLPLDPNARRRPLPAAADRDERLPDSRTASVEDGSGGPAELPWATRPTVVAAADDPAEASAPAVPLRRPAAIADLVDVPFELLSPPQLRRLGQWLDALVVRWPSRRSRRTRVAVQGRRVALRPTLARARRTGWEPVSLVRTGRVRRPRRVVVLCDVSESMHAQASAYLHLMRALVLGGEAEAFAFGVELTRLTAVLRRRSAAEAMELAAERVGDRFGGTRIAAALRTLLRSHHGEALRGAVVLIGSDGWDSDPPAELAAAMARLRRRAHRVVWMNPRAGVTGFEPAVGSMAAALPYCDALVPADTFASLAAVLDALAEPAVRTTG